MTTLAVEGEVSRAAGFRSRTGTRRRLRCSTCSRARSSSSHQAVLAERSTERNHLDSLAAGASITETSSGSKRREE